MGQFVPAVDVGLANATASQYVWQSDAVPEEMKDLFEADKYDGEEMNVNSQWARAMHQILMTRRAVSMDLGPEAMQSYNAWNGLTSYYQNRETAVEVFNKMATTINDD